MSKAHPRFSDLLVLFLWQKGEGTAATDVGGGTADEGFKGAGLCLPGAGGLVVETQGVVAHGDADGLRLTRTEEDLTETFQFLDGTLYGRLLVADVELHRLSTCQLASVGHIDSEGDLFVGSDALLIGCHLAHLEGGIAQTVAEGEERL